MLQVLVDHHLGLPASMLVLCIALVIALWIWLFLRGRLATHLLPPGPPGIPLLGNLFDWPYESGWLRFTEWGRIFGARFKLYE